MFVIRARVHRLSPWLTDSDGLQPSAERKGPKNQAIPEQGEQLVLCGMVLLLIIRVYTLQSTSGDMLCIERYLKDCVVSSADLA